MQHEEQSGVHQEEAHDGNMCSYNGCEYITGIFTTASPTGVSRLEAESQRERHRSHQHNTHSPSFSWPI